MGSLISGPQALLLGAGLLAMGIVAGAILAIGFSVKQFVDAMAKIENLNSDKIYNNINKIKGIGSTLAEIGKANAPSLGGFIAGIFGEDTVSKIQQLESINTDKLTALATSLETIAKSLKLMNESIAGMESLNVASKVSEIVSAGVMKAAPVRETAQMKGGVSLTVNVNVTMDAGQVERAVVFRNESILRNALINTNPDLRQSLPATTTAQPQVHGAAGSYGK
jgi:hypothetical protein